MDSSFHSRRKNVKDDDIIISPSASVWQETIDTVQDFIGDGNVNKRNSRGHSRHEIMSLNGWLLTKLIIQDTNSKLDTTKPIKKI